MQKEQLINEIAITAELCGRSLSDKALMTFADVLSSYPDEQVFKALEKCRQGLDGPFTLPAVISRIDDGHPDVEVAWAACPRSEADSAVWTPVMAAAFFNGPSALLEAGDPIGARMAFKEGYERRLREARAVKAPAIWLFSPGWDVNDRQQKITQAVCAGLLTFEQAKTALPTLEYKPSDLVPAPPVPLLN